MTAPAVTSICGRPGKSRPVPTNGISITVMPLRRACSRAARLAPSKSVRPVASGSGAASSAANSIAASIAAAVPSTDVGDPRGGTRECKRRIGQRHQYHHHGRDCGQQPRITVGAQQIAERAEGPRSEQKQRTQHRVVGEGRRAGQRDGCADDRADNAQSASTQRCRPCCLAHRKSGNRRPPCIMKSEEQGSGDGQSDRESHGITLSGTRAGDP